MNHACADINTISCPPIPDSPTSVNAPAIFPLSAAAPPRPAAASPNRSRNALISVATIPRLVGAPMRTQSASNTSSGVAISASRIPRSYDVDVPFVPLVTSRASLARTTRTSAPDTARAPSAMTFASVTSFAVRLKKTTTTRNVIARAPSMTIVRASNCLARAVPSSTTRSRRDDARARASARSRKAREIPAGGTRRVVIGHRSRSSRTRSNGTARRDDRAKRRERDAGGRRGARETTTRVDDADERETCAAWTAGMSRT